MEFLRTPSCLAGLTLVLVPSLAKAQGQAVFSVDWHGPLIGAPDSFSGIPITNADLLTPVSITPVPGPLPIPGLWVSGGFGPPAPGLGIPTHPQCIGVPPCVLCPIELDAMSYGKDRNLQPAEPPGTLWFSVDEYSAGIPGTPFAPNVNTEGPFFGIDEAAGDAFVDIGLPPGPIPPAPVGPIIGNVAAIDGDGLPGGSGFQYPGLGLIEPNAPVLGPCNPGSNLDALTLSPGGPGPMLPAWFSLDTSFPDPLGFPNESTAIANGFVGGDVLFTPAPGAPPIVWAPAPALGLDRAGPPDSDDLDALILWENGTGVFEPSLAPYDWNTGNTDMVLFSVRRGSALVGLPDSIFGAPISEGDILTTPLIAGGLSPFPGIMFPAESLGLGTVRAGFPSPITGMDDDLNALSAPQAPLLDCNANGIEDAIDIAFGTSSDLNGNGIPDDCELIATSYCFGTGCPCGNNDPNAGCANSTGQGALMNASGTGSTANDDLVLTTTSMPPFQFGIFFMGTNQGNFPFGDGKRCVTGSTFRYNPPQNGGAAGSISLGPGSVLFSCTNFGPAGCILPSSTWNFQTWYRDPFGPCGNAFNTSNAISITFTL